MWKIWFEEIRKMASRKIIWCGLALTLIFVTFRLYGIVLREYTTTIEDQTYRGKEAIQKDQELAKEYAGPLTEEKVRSIYERFGFYYFDAEKNEFVGNFCNEYITYQMTNSLETDGDDPSEIRFYEGTDWENNAATLLKGNLKFDYNYGWEDFRETMTLVCVLLSIIFIIGMSPVFSEEYTLRTADILLTTRRGKSSAVWIKIAAALTFTIVVYCAVFLYMWLIYRSVFGTQGLDTSPVFLNGVSSHGYCPETTGGFFLLLFGLGLASMVLLSAMVIVVSAVCKSAFLSVVISAVVFVLPYIWMKVFLPMRPFGIEVTRKVYHFMISMPFYMHMNWGFAFSAGEIGMHLIIALGVMAVCVNLGYRKYRNYQGGIGS